MAKEREIAILVIRAIPSGPISGMRAFDGRSKIEQRSGLNKSSHHLESTEFNGKDLVHYTLRELGDNSIDSG